MRNHFFHKVTISLLILLIAISPPFGRSAQAESTQLIEDRVGLSSPVETWRETNPMAYARSHHTATLLTDGTVLIVGGYTNPQTNYAELFDPMTNTWKTTVGYIGWLLQDHTATLLTNGKVLVAGGYNRGTSAPSAVAMLYNPETGLWQSTNSLSEPRQFATATLLNDGRVLVTGGYGSDGYYKSSCEIYNPSTGQWSLTYSMGTVRGHHTATRLQNGNVLVIGGLDINFEPLNTAEIYDPSMDQWSSAGTLGYKIADHAAVLLQNGKVLVTGGANLSITNQARIYDPIANSWSATNPMLTTRRNHQAVVLPDGRVLVAGGYGTTWLDSAEIYNPDLGTWSVIGSMNAVRGDYFTATLLPNGSVLAAGGYTGSTYLNSAEIFKSDQFIWNTTSSMNTPRYQNTATLLPNGQVLVAGGRTLGVSSTVLSTSERYNPISNTWAQTTGEMYVSRSFHTSTLLPDGRVLVTGGTSGGGLYHATAEIYDPLTDTWSLTNPMSAARMWHTATLLPDGKVLVTGGTGAINFKSAEIYDPKTEEWEGAGEMSVYRYAHTATLLQNGEVLVAGGHIDNWHSRDSVEIFDANGDWQLTGSMLGSRGEHTATLLADGRVLVAGGLQNSDPWPVYLNTYEIWGQSGGVWNSTGYTMHSPRVGHTATLLPDGLVLVTGGRDTKFTMLTSTEILDPLDDLWVDGPSLSVARYRHTATLLKDGNVLVVGGYESSSAEEVLVRDLHIPEDLRPVIDEEALGQELVLEEEIEIIGSGFTGSASTGVTSIQATDTSTNFPLVQLRLIGSEQILWLPVKEFSSTRILTIPLGGINPGPALLTVYVNGIPSYSASVVINPIVLGSISGVVTCDSTHTVIVELFTDDTTPPPDEIVPIACGETYSFTDLPDGTYYIVAFIDLNESGGGPPDPGEPYAWYGDPTAVTISGGETKTGINITFPTEVTGAIEGTVTCDSTHTVFVDLYVGDTTQSPDDTVQIACGETYSFTNLPDDTYYVGAWIDLNDSGGGPPDEGEPIAWYGDPTAVTISGGETKTGINIAIKIDFLIFLPLILR